MVLNVLLLTVQVFWDMTLCHWESGSWYFYGSYNGNVEDSSLLGYDTLSLGKWFLIFLWFLQWYCWGCKSSGIWHCVIGKVVPDIFMVLTVVLLRVQVFWDMTLCHWESGSWYFYGSYSGTVEDASLLEYYTVSLGKWFLILWFLEWYCWGFKSSGIWHCVIGRVVPDIFRVLTVVFLRTEVFWDMTLSLGKWFLIFLWFLQWYCWWFKSSGIWHCVIGRVVPDIFMVLTVVLLRVQVSWDITICHWESSSWYLYGSYSGTVEVSSLLGNDTVSLGEWFLIFLGFLQWYCWGFKSPGIWHFVIGNVVPDIFMVLTVVLLRVRVFWDMTLCHWESGSWYFYGSYSGTVEGSSFLGYDTLSLGEWFRIFLWFLQWYCWGCKSSGIWHCVIGRVVPDIFMVLTVVLLRIQVFWYMTLSLGEWFLIFLGVMPYWRVKQSVDTWYWLVGGEEEK